MSTEIIQEDVRRIVESLIQFKEKITDKTFLITGGAGFIGSWICDVLDRFHAKIICVDNLITGDKGNIKHLFEKPNFKFIQHDITKPLKIEENIDYIIHMASIASPPLYQKYPIETLQTNILGTFNMLEVSKEKNVKAFLFTSTSEVYGDMPNNLIPTSEDSSGVVNSYGPRAVYDEGKRAAEAYCFSYFEQFKLPIRIARIFNTYGPRLDVKSTSQYGRAIVKFISQALENNPITIYGDGKQTRSFCYIIDQIIGLFKLLLVPGLDGEVVNIGNDKEIMIKELADNIVEIFNTNVAITFNAQSDYDLTHDPRRRCPALAKAKRLLGYEPQTNLVTGLKKTIEWFKEKNKIS